jgi:hypothetical protein
MESDTLLGVNGRFDDDWLCTNGFGNVCPLVWKSMNESVYVCWCFAAVPALLDSLLDLGL